MSDEPASRRQKTTTDSHVVIDIAPEASEDAAATEEARLQHELKVLKLIPGCTGVGESKYNGA